MPGGHPLILYRQENPRCKLLQRRQVDEHETILESHYQQWDILEHIRLVDQDRYRYRAIYSWENGDLSIVEHHHEIRLSDSLPLIDDE
jgi:hypothetical protein